MSVDFLSEKTSFLNNIYFFLWMSTFLLDWKLHSLTKPKSGEWFCWEQWTKPVQRWSVRSSREYYQNSCYRYQSMNAIMGSLPSVCLSASRSDDKQLILFSRNIFSVHLNSINELTQHHSDEANKNAHSSILLERRPIQIRITLESLKWRCQCALEQSAVRVFQWGQFALIKE